ncbi:hypothetical protein LVD15_07815 [Fulvivirga maritima]|uniref:hypothetical protein n=1 Tax=Fulvivirga maritima TaxID=2904247 RepID=UPI001F32D999|nr:hypothetical protein [Fulvivirga maritima]UII28324.1 hypothetical protein LVD15_07815 [Fulvivirga maritima]
MLLSIPGFSQLDEKMDYEDVTHGVVIIKGKRVEGYIREKGTTYFDDQIYDAPWSYQSAIRFVPKDVFEEKEKIKNKDYEKYDAKDIDGYIYYPYEGDSLVFESVKYADLTGVGTSMIPKKMFMRKITDDKISLFYHYSSPMSMGEVSAMRQSYLDSKEPNLVYQTEDKIRLVENLNVEKELSDCPAVVEKYKNNEYKAIGDENSNSGFNKFINKTAFRDKVRLLVIEDYNKTCGE